MSKVLIVVDMQNDFVYGSLGTEESRKIVLNVKNKIKQYDDNGYDIIFTRDTHYDDYYLETQEGKHLPVVHCICGSDGWRIVDGLDLTKREPLVHIDKESFGYIYWDCNIYDDVDTIEIVGVCTDICVVSNALILKATFPETQIIVDASCCAGTTPEAHKAALTVMKSCQIDVVNEN